MTPKHFSGHWRDSVWTRSGADFAATRKGISHGRTATARRISDTAKTLASTSALPPNPCQKVEESSNGWKRGSGTLHSRTCMVPLGNLHGWTRASAWLDFPKCMVALPALHGWTFKARSGRRKDTPSTPPHPNLNHLGEKCFHRR